MNEYKQYRFSIHDEHPRLRHYSYGKDIYCNDDDGSDLMYEHDGINNIAVFEEKHGGIHSIDKKDFSLLAERCRLRDRTLYGFINIYYYFKSNVALLQAKQNPNNLDLLTHAQHYIIPINHKSASLLGHNGVLMSEYDWVGILYRIRGLKMPELNLHRTVLKGIPLEVLNKNFLYDD